MSYLANNPHILNIFGYGWNVERGDIIPYLVTEFAADGTLRNFLKSHKNRISIYEKLLFCRDVAQGLHSLHVSGIAHGDLKLDNVLVTPFTDKGSNASGGPQGAAQDATRASGLVACVSDFGHSLHLYDKEGDVAVRQRYGGTLAYNAPEVLLRSDGGREDLNFRKCDVWSLGLLCWETLDDGRPYYNSSEVQSSLQSSQSKSGSGSASTQSHSASSSQIGLFDELGTIAPQLLKIACDEVTNKVDQLLSPRETSRLETLLKLCLAFDPQDRVAEVSSLPILARKR
jgi:serine/threonine protein kinase